MALIKNFLKIITVVVLLSSASVFAGDFLVNTTIDDNAADEYVNGGTPFNIDSMDIQWADDGLITVDIYTNFVDSNNYYYTSTGRGKNKIKTYIVFGDLLISTEGSSDFDYAFILSEGRDTSSSAGEHFENQGTFTEISSTTSSNEYHNTTSSAIGSGQVMADITVGSGTSSTWSIDNYSSQTDVISFSFNVSGIAAFQNASQLAFSWGMSCANDIVSGVVDVTRSTANSIPEPATMLLMLLALGFMANSRKHKADDFSA